MNRAGRGRPLRFITLVGLGWIVLRVVLLSRAPAVLQADQANPPPADRIVTPLRVETARAAPALPPAAMPHPARTMWRRMAHVETQGAGGPIAMVESGERAPALPSPAVAAAPRMAPLPDGGARRGTFLPDIDHWRGSAWLAFRPGQGIGAAPGSGQIGGSQYGVRLAYDLDSAGRVAAYGRVAGPLRGRGAEAALGLEWRPYAAPVRIALEQRIGLDGTRGGPGIGLIGGVDRALSGFRLESYGQAGMILRHRVEPYADGALRVTRPVRAARNTGLTAGLGLWGAAQRGAQRLDIGPTLVGSLPLGEIHARLALDWRQRVAGSARPGSGAAVTLGADF